MYGYTVITGIIIWCMMACTWTAPEIMGGGEGSKPKKNPLPPFPHKDKKGQPSQSQRIMRIPLDPDVHKRHIRWSGIKLNA